MGLMDWLTTIGGIAGAPFTGGATLPLALSGLGGLLSNQSAQQTSGSSTPTTSPQFSPLRDLLLQTITTRLKGDGTGNYLPPEYEPGGVAAINSTYAPANQTLQNSLTSRGLGRSPVAVGAETTLNASRASDISRFRSSLPLVNQGLQTQAIGLGQGFLPFGTGNLSTGTGAGQSGGGLAGGLTNLAGMLGYLYGKRGPQ